MKIQGNKKPDNMDVQISAQKISKTNTTPEKGKAEKATISDRVELSGRARQIAELKSAIEQLPDIRVEKVQEIKKAIAEGTYKIDSRKIAGKLIDELV